MAKGKMMMPGGLNMNSMLKQAQKMQEDMLKAQEEVGKKEFEASAGGGAIKVVVNGKNELVSIKLEKSVVDPDDVEMLEDLITVAVNEALRTAAEASSKEISKYTGGLNLPGLF
jgi:nucleoid-associated protein EbfC